MRRILLALAVRVSAFCTAPLQDTEEPQYRPTSFYCVLLCFAETAMLIN